MYGEDGWCHSCGVPKREQTGSLVLQRKGLTVVGCWTPYWVNDGLCLERSIGEELEAKFDIVIREIKWPRQTVGDAVQVIIPTVGESWFDADDLRQRAESIHGGRAGATCAECGVWRWYPVPTVDLPIKISPAPTVEFDIAASPEWFGDGWEAAHDSIVRREMAEIIVAASPRDFSFVELPPD